MSGSPPGPAGVDWSALHAAYGPADVVPGLLRDVVGDVPSRRADALTELWGTVWHQGTVYEVTPVVVPLLVDLVANHRLLDGTRAELALLLASTAAASSFVEGDGWFVAAFARDTDDPVPVVELDERCREVLVAALGALDPVLAAGPPLVRRAAVAVAATVAVHLSGDARAALTALAAHDDPLLATAAGIVVDLATGDVPLPSDLLARAAVDDESLDFLTHIPSWPAGVQAVELVRELSERAVAAQLGEGAAPRG